MHHPFRLCGEDMLSVKEFRAIFIHRHSHFNIIIIVVIVAVVVSWWWSWLSSLWRWWWWTWLSPLSSLLLSPMSWCQICEGLEHSRKRTFHNFHSQYVLTPFPNPPFHRFEKLDGIFKKLRNCNFHFGCQRMMLDSIWRAVVFELDGAGGLPADFWGR